MSKAQPVNLQNTASTGVGGSHHTKARTPDQIAQAAIAGIKPAPTTNNPKGDEYRKQYEVLHIGMGIPGTPGHKMLMDLKDLGKRLGVTEIDLARFALRNLLENPPAPGTVQRTSRTGARGQAAGFWITIDKTEAGYAKQFNIMEVSARGDLDTDMVQGGTFFRYEPGNFKSRNRVLKSARVKAEENRKLFNIQLGVHEELFSEAELREEWGIDANAEGSLTADDVVDQVINEVTDGVDDEVDQEDPDTDASNED